MQRHSENEITMERENKNHSMTITPKVVKFKKLSKKKSKIKPRNECMATWH